MSAQSLLKWREAQAARSSFSCVPITLEACENWSLDKGVLRHRTGGFFSIPGLKCEGLPGREGPVYQPIIDQPEIGILGFALCERDGVPGIVVQAKTEPGNVGISQLAPTFQCTESNYKALHGGTPAPFLDWFSGVDARRVVSNGLQSEQATRFLGKRNRNLVVEVDEARTHDLPEAWRWIAMDDICDAILTDDLFNTDARSVLVSSDWNRLVRGRAPFTRRNDDLSAALALSFEQSGDDIGDARAWIAALRAGNTARRERIPLSALPGWAIRPEGVIAEDPAAGEFAVRYFAVRALDREVPVWCQPLVDSRGMGTVGMIAQRRGGVLKFLVRMVHEPADVSGGLLVATVHCSPGHTHEADPHALAGAQDVDTTGAILHFRNSQSEEGGRFYRDETDYWLMELPETAWVPERKDRRWLDLKTLQQLCRDEFVTSNELRSLISFLLRWL